jgi:hypothetical protein
MGQQQLLLVILVTIIVGIATVVAINIFGQAADQANRDAVRQDLMAASVQAQAVWARPAMMNGAGRDFTSLTPSTLLLQRLGIPGEYNDGDSQIENENGTYTISGVEAEGLTLIGTPASGDQVIQAVLSRDDNNNWQVAITDEDGTVESGEGE